MPLRLEDLIRRINGSAQGIPDENLGPTKTIFTIPGTGRASTHLNARDDEKIFPLLVPNQVGLEGLYFGLKPTREQYDRAESYAEQHPESSIPLPKGMKGNSKEADDFEQAWHKKFEEAGKPYTQRLIK